MVRVKRPLPKDEADEPVAKTSKLQSTRRKCKLATFSNFFVSNSIVSILVLYSEYL